jgi:hypothetical protein
MNCKMPIGIDDFGKIRNKEFYFVDKTAFIRQLIDSPREVTLITRPRRFGKTLTMSMLEYFFSIEKESQSRHLFDHLAIEQAGPEYMAQRGQYPVIFLTLKDIQNPSWLTWERMLSFIRLFLAQVYDRYRYIRERADINDVQARLFDHVVQGQATEDELALSLTNLMAMMQTYYGRKVILLIDEYDAPIQQAWESGYYTGCIGFMRQFLSSALKTNDTLEFAVLTGITRISKESIFSGLNNLDVCSVLRNQYAGVFGFTEAEIQELLETAHHGEKISELKKWYDGYHIGHAEIYNPWSVINYVANDCQARPYWARTSGNSILRHLLSHTDELRVQMIQNLLHGKAVRVTLDDSLIYSEIDRDPGALFNLLLTTGYLTVEKVLSLSDDRYALRIPNEEIRKLYSTEILNSLGENVTKNTFDDLFDYLIEGEAENFALQLQQLLKAIVSVYDTANKESFYHGFMLGMTALFLEKDYNVVSNRESGYGRFDLAIFPKDKDDVGVIMEFKVAVNEVELQEKANEALRQIETQEYITEFQTRGIHDVWKYGIAFYKKKVAVVRAGDGSEGNRCEI